MGSYNVLCSVSRHVIECSDKVKLIPFSNGQCISPVVIDAEYDDYGYFEIDNSKGTSKGLEALASTLAVIDPEYNTKNTLQKMNCCTLKMKDEYSSKEHSIGFVVVLSDVYDYLVSESKEKYKDNYRKLNERNVAMAMRMCDDKIHFTKEQRLDKIQNFIDYLKKDDEDNQGLIEMLQDKYNKIQAGVGCTEIIKELSKSGLINTEIMSVYAVGSVIEDIQDFIDLEYFLMYVKYDLDLELPMQENAKQSSNNFEKAIVLSEVQRIAFNQTNAHFNISAQSEIELTLTQTGIDELTVPNWSDTIQLEKDGDVYKIASLDDYDIKEYNRKNVIIKVK